MKLKGTDFQVKVWKYLLKIPKGKVKTYKQVAIAIKNPFSARAVGNAVGKNPYAPQIPCHRVIQKSGSLGGYHWGLSIKNHILNFENERSRNPIG